MTDSIRYHQVDIYIKKPSLDDLDLVKFNDRIAKRSLEYIRGWRTIPGIIKLMYKKNPFVRWFRLTWQRKIFGKWRARLKHQFFSQFSQPQMELISRQIFLKAGNFRDQAKLKHKNSFNFFMMKAFRKTVI